MLRRQHQSRRLLCLLLRLPIGNATHAIHEAFSAYEETNAPVLPAVISRKEYQFLSMIATASASHPSP